MFKMENKFYLFRSRFKTKKESKRIIFDDVIQWRDIGHPTFIT